MHEVHGLIADAESMKAFASGLGSANVIALAQGLALLPATNSLIADLGRHASDPGASHDLPLGRLSTTLTGFALKLSEVVPVAFIETVYFGGGGGQNAVVWRDRRLVLGPWPPGYHDPNLGGPIDQALRYLGVVRRADMDEFDTIGLGAHRLNEHWIEHGPRA